MSSSGCSLLAGIGQLHAMLGDAEAASEYCETALPAYRRSSAAAWDGRKGRDGLGRVGRERARARMYYGTFQLYDASACSEPARLVDLLDQLGSAHKEAGVHLPLFIATYL